MWNVKGSLGIVKTEGPGNSLEVSYSPCPVAEVLTVYEVSEDPNVDPATTKWLKSEKQKHNFMKVEITFGLRCFH